MNKFFLKFIRVEVEYSKSNIFFDCLIVHFSGDFWVGFIPKKKN